MITASAQTILETWICPWCRASKTSHSICDGCKDKQMIEVVKFNANIKAFNAKARERGNKEMQSLIKTMYRKLES